MTGRDTMRRISTRREINFSSKGLIGITDFRVIRGNTNHTICKFHGSHVVIIGTGNKSSSVNNGTELLGIQLYSGTKITWHYSVIIRELSINKAGRNICIIKFKANLVGIVIDIYRPWHIRGQQLMNFIQNL